MTPEWTALPLPLIGWLYTLICGGALAIGAWLVVGVHLSWILGLAGGVGILLGKTWSAVVLEFFCWVLIVLVTLTAVSRFRAAEPPRITLGLSLALFVVPVLAFCGATIYTLRASGPP